MCRVTVSLVMVILFLDFDYVMLIFFEYYTLIFFYLVRNIRSSYERGSANVFIMVFGYIIRFAVVMSNSLVMMGLMLLLLGIAKLPIFRVHIWLPKVHVEASIVGSMVLAGAVLKLRILYVWNFRNLIIVGLIVVMSCVIMMRVVDRKAFAAYSSVLHMTLCVLLGIIVMLLVGYIHIVISPLIFITVYIRYIISRSRFYMKIRLVMIILWIVNFRLPFLRSFFSEVYVIQYGTCMLVMLVIIYMVVGYIMMKSINMDGKGVFIIPWLTLYIMVI